MTTRFLWEGFRLLQEIHDDVPLTYVYSDAESYEPLARIDGTKDPDIFWFHCQPNGTPERMTDREGHIRWEGQNSAWGKLLHESIPQEMGYAQNLRMQGQYLDRETGLHYNLFRYYDPDSARFTQQDPIGLKGGLNLYQYAPNPLSWIDPLGLTACFRTMKKDNNGNYVNSPLDGAPNGTQKGARTEGSNPKFHDFSGVNSADDMVGPSYTGKQGLSGSQVPLPVDPKRGTVNAVTDLDKLPDGLGAINDHGSHISIYPSRDMTFGEYQKLLNQIEWD